MGQSQTGDHSMKRKLTAALIITVGLIVGGGTAVLAASQTTGTNVACATATAPAHTIGVDATSVYTVPAVTRSACNTVTYTIPTVTQTVPGTTSSTSTTSSTTTTSTTPTTTTSTTSTSSTTSSAGQWAPPQNLHWYWQLQGTVPIKANIDVTDMDGFDNTAATVANFHAAGQKAICYIDVGTSENWRSDYSQFPAGLKGNSNGWPGENWLDVRPTGPYYSTLQAIMTARFQMCQQKGFDAVEPDNMDSWDNNPGFPTTAADQAAYNEWIANTVHALGMAVFQKNDPNQSSTLQPYFDGVISEQAFQYGDTYTPYETAKKPHLDAEYSAQTCHSPPTVMQAQFSVNLDGSVFKPCW